jgi:hypothetical protein
MRRLSPTLLGLGLAVLVFAAPARADLFLSFDQSSYSTFLGQNVAVQVLLTQTPTGIQVTPSNTLLGAAIRVAYNNPSGIVSVQSITAGPAWDFGNSNTGPPTATLATSSLAGIGTIPAGGLLLGTFTFRGLAPGSTVISVSTQTPGTSFPTSQGNFLDPTNTGTATIRVVPEPASITIAATGLFMALTASTLRVRMSRAKRV